MYLIIKGRVSCRLAWNICFKVYVEGSYFGDIELFRKSLRLFSVKAEEDLVLAAIKREDFNRIVSMNPTFSLMIFGRTLQRYIKVKTSIQRVAAFNKLPVANSWWNHGLDDTTPINSKISDWLDLIKDQQQMKLNGSVGGHSSAKSFALKSVSSVSKTRKSNFSPADKMIATAAANHLAAARQASKKRLPLTKLEDFTEQLQQIEDKLAQLSNICSQLGRDQVALDEKCTAMVIEVVAW